MRGFSHERKRDGGWYAYPQHRSWWRRLLWRLGFDPLTVRERLAQVRIEAADWKRWGDEAAVATRLAWCPRGVSPIEWADRIQETKHGQRSEVEEIVESYR